MPDHRISYLRHFIDQKAVREFPDGFAETLFHDADNYYRDHLRGRFVAVKRSYFKGRERDIALVYEIEDSGIVFVTITMLKEGQQQNRVSSGRWERHEPEINL